MNAQKRMTLICALAAVLAGSSALGAEAPIPPMIDAAAPQEPVQPQMHAKPAAHVVAAQAAAELPTSATGVVGFGARSSFTSSSVSVPDATTLSPPVTLTYAGTSPTLLVNDSGTNKAVEANITNTGNGASAVFGQTNGGGAGVTGQNAGTKGPGGKFAILDASSAQPAVTTTTNGTGSALLATITTADSSAPAILGQNQVSSGFGIGVEGQGNYLGVEGSSAYTGVYGTGTSLGVWGYSSAGYGLYGESSSGYGLYAYSGSSYGAYTYSDTGIGLYSYSSSNKGISAETYSGTAIYANDDTSGYGLIAHSASGFGIYSSSDSYYAIWGQSKNQYAVIGEDSGSGVGIYGSSATGYAGLFSGKVGASSFVTVSDRNAKAKIQSIDGKTILDKVSNLPISSWVFKTDPQKNHVGPMAQDFHDAFGLDGDDDKHINLTDISGVSLAAIQELNKEMKEQNAKVSAQLASRDAEIASLKAQLTSMAATFSARMTALERQQQRLGAATQTASLKKEIGPQGE
jgi:hypothetical protein